MCRVATSHDLADGYSLLEAPGWATLLAILQESGERPPKRPSPFASESRGSYSSADGFSHDDQLAKKFKGASLR